MRNALLFLPAAALLSLSAPAAAGDRDAKSQETPAAKAEKEPRKICKMVDGSESRLKRKRVCLTAEQWKKASF